MQDQPEGLPRGRWKRSLSRNILALFVILVVISCTAIQLTLLMRGLFSETVELFGDQPTISEDPRLRLVESKQEEVLEPDGRNGLPPGGAKTQLDTFNSAAHDIVHERIRKKEYSDKKRAEEHTIPSNLLRRNASSANDTLVVSRVHQNGQPLYAKKEQLFAANEKDGVVYDKHNQPINSTIEGKGNISSNSSRSNISPASETVVVVDGNHNHNHQPVNATTEEQQSFPKANETTDIQDPPSHLLDEVVHMFLPTDKARAYISLHPWKDFKFYVYDLEYTSSWTYLHECMEKQFKPKNISLEEFQNQYCDWGTSICSPTSQSDNPYSSRRNNKNMDGVMTKLFQEYQGPMRTSDPESASMFVVPFATSTFFFCHGGMKKAKTITSLEALEQNLLRKLQFWNASKESHLFFQSVKGDLHKLQEPIVASVNNPGQPNGGKHFIMPYVNTHSHYQPAMLLDLQEEKTFDDVFGKKKYSMAAVLSTKISGKGIIRQQFVNRSEELFGAEIGGLPINIRNLQEGSKPRRKFSNEQEVMSLYRHSIFCPSLRGDSPDQKRFFDAILSGCLPVVLTYRFHSESDPDGVNLTSYFGPNVPLKNYLPFAKGSFEGEPDMGIDYSQLVVEVDGACGLACMKPTLEALMKNPEELRRKQKAVARYARLFSVGLEDNAWKYVDAVTALLVHARHEIMNRRQN
jgi:hypothetical protein